MIRKHAKLFIIVMILCIVVVFLTIVYVLDITSKSMTKSSSPILSLDKAVKFFEERLRRVLLCVSEGKCSFYTIDVVMIVTPSRNGFYSVHIYAGGLNYTRGSIYSDTITRRVVVNKFSYHMLMLSDGILRGYEEWLGIEKRLGIHLDVGHGIYDRSRDTLLIHVDLPTFKFCEIAHACGEFYTNATLYIDSEKYVIWQFAKLNFSYLIDKGYIKIRKVENGYAYPINPPAVMRFTYIESPFWRIPTELLNGTRIPIIITLHIATTNRSIHENYLKILELFRPLIEARLANPYISEVSHGNHTKFIELSDKVNKEAIQKFIKNLHHKIIAKLYPDTSIMVKYVENPHGGDYYIARWRDIELIAYVGTLEVHIHNVTSNLIETLISIVLKTTPLLC